MQGYQLAMSRCDDALVSIITTFRRCSSELAVMFVGLSVGSERMQGTVQSSNPYQQKQVTNDNSFPPDVAAEIHNVKKKR